jgi:hypothetical protein
MSWTLNTVFSRVAAPLLRILFWKRSRWNKITHKQTNILYIYISSVWEIFNNIQIWKRNDNALAKISMEIHLWQIEKNALACRLCVLFICVRYQSEIQSIFSESISSERYVYLIRQQHLDTIIVLFASRASNSKYLKNRLAYIQYHLVNYWIKNV